MGVKQMGAIETYSLSDVKSKHIIKGTRDANMHIICIAPFGLPPYRDFQIQKQFAMLHASCFPRHDAPSYRCWPQLSCDVVLSNDVNNTLYEEFTRLAETRLTQNTLNYLNIY